MDSLRSYPKRHLTLWCDVFDTLGREHAPRGWLQLQLPGSTEVDVQQLQTMSQRLQKARELAAAADWPKRKYHLVQAVLLSLDSQPMDDENAVLTGIALEACCRVLLPEAEEVLLDMPAAQAAYERLSPEEQQLWRQLQEVRIEQFRTGCPVSLANG
jgi:hypothetical protein